MMLLQQERDRLQKEQEEKLKRIEQTANDLNKPMQVCQVSCLLHAEVCLEHLEVCVLSLDLDFKVFVEVNVDILTRTDHMGRSKHLNTIVSGTSGTVQIDNCCHLLLLFVYCRCVVVSCSSMMHHPG